MPSAHRASGKTFQHQPHREGANTGNPSRSKLVANSNPPNVAIDELRTLLRLDVETGKLFWLPRPHETFSNIKRAASWNAKYANKEAFTADKGNGYKVGRIHKKSYLAHRVVWALHHGVWPEHEIDHINGTRDDNHPVNLRDVSGAENHKNVGQRINHASGVTGVYWHRQISKWIANITVDGKTRYLGAFASKDDAAQAYEEAKTAHGYHPNHGTIRKVA